MDAHEVRITSADRYFELPVRFAPEAYAEFEAMKREAEVEGECKLFDQDVVRNALALYKLYLEKNKEGWRPQFVRGFGEVEEVNIVFP